MVVSTTYIKSILFPLKFLFRGQRTLALSSCWEFCLSACLPAYLPAYLPACLSACLPVCLSVCLSVCPSVCLSVCLSVSLLVCLSIRPSVSLPAYLPACLSICLSFCLFLTDNDNNNNSIQRITFPCVIALKLAHFFTPILIHEYDDSFEVSVPLYNSYLVSYGSN